jgi:hypothetical protein
VIPAALRLSERCYKLGLTHCRWFIADDRGMVCPRDSLNYGTGCCTDGEQHACTRCCSVLLPHMVLLARSCFWRFTLPLVCLTKQPPSMIKFVGPPFLL